MRCCPINSQKFTMIKIVIAVILIPTLQKIRKRLTALNPKPNRPVKATNITLIGHTPVKTRMTISIIIPKIVKRRPSPSHRVKTSINRKIMKNKLNKTKITQISVDKRSAPILMLHGSNFKDRNNIRNNENISMKHHNKRKWEISLKQWEDLHRLIMCFGPDTIWDTQICWTKRSFRRKNNNRLETWCLKE